MPVLLNLRPDYLDDHGGRQVSLRVQWSTVERANHGSPGGRLPQGTRWRVGLYVATAPGVWEVSPRGFLYSGVAGQAGVLYSAPQDLAASDPLEYIQGWSPLLATGVYWPKVQYWTGAAWATLAGTNPVYGASGFPDDPVVLLARPRLAEVYRVRQGFPTPPYKVGARYLEQEAWPV